MISRSVSVVRCATAFRTGKAHGRQSVLVMSASSPDKPNVPGKEPSASPASDSSEVQVTSSTQDPDESWKAPFSVAQIFGSYLQLGVWVVVLSVAGYTGIQKAQTNPEQVGILLAPPAAAIFLMASFALYRVLTNEKYEDDSKA